MIKEVVTKNGTTVFEFGGKMLKVSIGNIEDDVDSDVLSKIDLNNIVGEIVTTPVLVNRWGNIQAEVERQLQMEKLDFEIWCAKQKEAIRNGVLQTEGEKVKKLTVDEVETALTIAPDYYVKQKKIIETEKAVAIVKSLYWALKDKSDKLNKLSLTLNREDLHNIKTMVMNGIKIIIKKQAVEEE